LRERLTRLRLRNMEALIEATVVDVRSRFAAYKERPASELEASVRLCYHAYMDFLQTGSFVSLTDYIGEMARRRSDEQVRISAIQAVFLTFREVVMPVLQAEFKDEHEHLLQAFGSVLRAESQALGCLLTFVRMRLRRACVTHVCQEEKNRAPGGIVCLS